MATKLAQSQLAELPERVGVVETKVEHLNEKMDELKDDVKEMHDCLDNTRDLLSDKLEKMTIEYRDNAAKYYVHAEELNDKQSAQHKELAAKISELETLKDKWVKYAMMILAFAAGSGWITNLHLPQILKFLGL